MSAETVNIDGDILRETDNALLISVDGEEIWLPLSQVSYIRRGRVVDTVTITAWIAKQKGLSE